jgi:conjugal transfer pilus assembly protein TraE
MNTEQYYGELDMEKRKNRRLQWALGACVVSILILSSTIRAQVGKERSAFVPPEITKPFWISSEEASPEYFEQLGPYVNGLTLNVTPETVSTACNQYLTYVLPKDRDKFRKRCDIESARIKRDSASQMFSVREVRTDATHHRVALLGTLTTMISDKTFKNNEAYLIEFVHADGRFYVSNHEKVDANDPFGIKKQASN